MRNAVDYEAVRSEQRRAQEGKYMSMGISQKFPGYSATTRIGSH